MGRYSVEKVIRILYEAGYRVGRAYPGGRMPHIQVPSVAVAVQREDETALVLEITVLIPDTDGGAACEDVAMGVASVLRDKGIQCVQEHCQHDGKGDRFTVRIIATCKTPEKKLPITAYMGNTTVPYLVSFTAEQRTDVETVGAMGQSEPAGVVTKPHLWEFTVEEQLPRELEGPSVFDEPFHLQVHRGLIREEYDGCYWTSYYSHDNQDGMRVIRKGIAQRRRVMDDV